MVKYSGDICELHTVSASDDPIYVCVCMYVYVCVCVRACVCVRPAKLSPIV